MLELVCRGMTGNCWTGAWIADVGAKELKKDKVKARDTIKDDLDNIVAVVLLLYWLCYAD